MLDSLHGIHELVGAYLGVVRGKELMNVRLFKEGCLREAGECHVGLEVGCGCEVAAVPSAEYKRNWAEWMQWGRAPVGIVG